MEADGNYVKYQRASLRLEFCIRIRLLPSEEREANLLSTQSEDFSEHLYYGRQNKLFTSPLISIQLSRLCGTCR